MNESGKWTDVDYSEVGNVTIEKNPSNHNIKLSLMVSPMDVPVAWRHLDDDGKVTLEFKYLSATESLVNRNIEDNITFVLGKNSKRIYKIVVDVKGFVSMGARKGEVSIELVQVGEVANNATSALNERGVVKKPNAKAIMHMLEHEPFAMNTAAG